jgi:hypothetical protein
VSTIDSSKDACQKQAQAKRTLLTNALKLRSQILKRPQILGLRCLPWDLSIEVDAPVIESFWAGQGPLCALFLGTRLRRHNQSASSRRTTKAAPITTPTIHGTVQLPQGKHGSGVLGGVLLNNVAFGEVTRVVAEFPDVQPLVVLGDETTVPALTLTLHVPQQTRADISSFWGGCRAVSLLWGGVAKEQSPPEGRMHPVLVPHV